MMTLPALGEDQDNYLFISNSMGSLGTFQQFASSNTLFTADYSEFLATDETLTNVAFSASPSTTPPLSISSSNLVAIGGHSAKGASFLVGGGVAGTVYQLGLVATTSLAQNKVDTLNLQITVNSNGVASGVSFWPYGVGYPAGFAPAVGGMTPIGSTDDDVTGGGSTAIGTQHFTVLRYTVDAAVIQIAAARVGRRSLKVKNAGFTSIEISDDPALAFGAGTPIAHGEEIEIDSQAAAYAISDTAGGSVAVQEEH